MPAVDVALGPLKLPSLDLPGMSTLWSHMFTSTTWSRDLLPGFRYAMGPVWWAVVAICVGGLLVAVVTPRIDGRIRLMGIVGLASAVIYLFSPQALGLFGTASFFRYDVRYLAISFTLGRWRLRP